MTPAYQVLYDYSFRITGNKRRSRAIVDYVILEGARIFVETGDPEEAQAFMVTKVSTMSYDFNRRREKRWFRGMWERGKALIK